MSKKSFMPEIKIVGSEKDFIEILARLVIQELEKSGAIEKLQPNGFKS